MKSITTLATVLVFLGANVGNVFAGCYTSGESWGTDDLRQEARDAVYDRCNNGPLNGYWAPGEAKSACKQLTTNLKANFFIQNLNTDAGFNLRTEDCIQRLTNEIDGCWQGGSSDVAGWRFKSDPNAGAC